MAQRKSLHELSKINGKINTMGLSDLQDRLRELGLSCIGEAEVLRQRLKRHAKLDFAHLLPPQRCAHASACGL